MKLRHLLLAAALTLTAIQARAQGFTDSWMGVRDALTELNPGGANGDGKGSRDVNKVIVNVGTFNVWDYGSNFLSLDILLSNPNENALNSSGGSTELYGVYPRPAKPRQDLRSQHQVRTRHGDQFRIRWRPRNREYRLCS